MSKINIKIKEDTISQIITSVFFSIIILTVVHYFGKFEKYYAWERNYYTETSYVKPSFICPLKTLHRDPPKVYSNEKFEWTFFEKVKHSFIKCFDDHWIFLIITTIGVYIGFWILENVSIDIE